MGEDKKDRPDQTPSDRNIDVGNVDDHTHDTPEESSSSSEDRLLWEGSRWASVPIDLFKIRELSVQARLLYAYLLTYVNPHEELIAWPSQDRMAGDLGKTERTIRGWLTELERFGILEKFYRVEVDPDFRGNPGARLYRLLPPAIPTGEILPVPHKYRETGKKLPVRSEENFRSDRRDSSAEQTKEQIIKQNDDEISEKNGLLDDPIYRIEDELLELGVSKGVAAKICTRFEDGDLPRLGTFVGWCLKYRKEPSFIVAALRDGWYRDAMKSKPRNVPEERCPECGETSSQCRHEWGSKKRLEKWGGEL